jgi:hypothetical protein
MATKKLHPRAVSGLDNQAMRYQFMRLVESISRITVE